MNTVENAENILLAIPARGGSKRLPRKNLAMIHGKPMIVYTIEAAINARLANDVFVCTEDEEIANVSEEHGAKVFPIPASMAGDLVSSTDPCLALYDKLIEDGINIDYIFALQPTSPLRTADDIRNSFKILSESDADFLVSVTPIDPHYFHWAFVENQNGWTMYFGKEFMKERPLLPPVYRPNGAIKLASASQLKEFGHFLFHDQPISVHMMLEERSIHVATQFDLTCVRTMFTERKGGANSVEA